MALAILRWSGISFCDGLSKSRGNGAVLARPVQSILLAVGADDLCGIFHNAVPVPIGLCVCILRRNKASTDLYCIEFIRAYDAPSDLSLTFHNIPVPASAFRVSGTANGHSLMPTTSVRLIGFRVLGLEDRFFGSKVLNLAKPLVFNIVAGSHDIGGLRTKERPYIVKSLLRMQSKHHEPLQEC